jgi:hypothetical protein
MYSEGIALELLSKYYWGDKMKQDGLSETFSMYDGTEMHKAFGEET